MVALRYQIFFCLFIILTPPLLAQDNAFPDLSVDFKDGLYLSLEEFKTNNPSIPLAKNELGNIGNGYVIRMKRIEYGAEEENKSISSWKVLFLCMDGTIFINHRSMKNEKNRYPVSYFYRIHHAGYFCNYFQHTYNRSLYKNAKKVEAFTNVFVPGMNLSVVEVSVGHPAVEYVLFLGDGKVYDVKKSARKLKALIKRDPHFAKTRIKNKELVIYLGLYNKRNSFEFGG